MRRRKRAKSMDCNELFTCGNLSLSWFSKLIEMSRICSSLWDILFMRKQAWTERAASLISAPNPVSDTRSPCTQIIRVWKVHKITMKANSIKSTMYMRRKDYFHEILDIHIRVREFSSTRNRENIVKHILQLLYICKQSWHWIYHTVENFGRSDGKIQARV